MSASKLIDPQVDRLPPHDLLNEQAVLGCILLEPSCLEEITGACAEPGSLFYDLRHKVVFAALRSLRTSQEPISVLTLITELRKANTFDSCGGLAYIAALPDATPSAAHLGYSLGEIQSKYVARRMIAACAEAVGEAYEKSGDMAALLARLESDVLQISTGLTRSEAKPAKEILRLCVDRYERLIAGQEAGIPTGFLPIDTNGGFFPGELVLVCGETGLGKSTLALNLMHTAFKAAIPTVLFSLEMSSEAWMDRLLSLDLGIDRRVFRNRSMFTEGILSVVAFNMNRISKLPLWASDDATAGVHDVRRIVKALVARQAVRLVVVDYAQIVSPPAYDSREQQVAAIGRAMRSLAQETKTVVILLSQLNDEGKVRESRALLHEAHVCLTLQNRESRLWITCTKGRDMQFPDFPVDFNTLECKLTQASQLPNRYEP